MPARNNGLMACFRHIGFQEAHGLYTDRDKGLVSIAHNLNLTLLAPRKKITIMLIGNHSAGKSSFINW